jgi:hypothetical protein
MAQPGHDPELGIMRVPVGAARLRARPREPAGGGGLAFAGTTVLNAAGIDAVVGITASPPF